jgi:hypothetical protein
MQHLNTAALEQKVLYMRVDFNALLLFGKGIRRALYARHVVFS